MEAWLLFTMLKAWRGLTSPLKIHTEVVLASHPYQKLCRHPWKAFYCIQMSYRAKQATDASANAVNCRRPCRWCLHDSNLSRRNHITSQTRVAACFTGTWTQWLYCMAMETKTR
ncbi:hypothetical protein HDV62DRAFT_357117 [Trichoderma sp. SZMC 28011]